MSLLLTCLLCFQMSPGEPPAAFLEADRVVLAAKIHIGDGKVLAPGWIAIKNGRVTGMGLMEQDGNGGVSRDASKGRNILDLGSAEVTPGLIDGVSHDGLARGARENDESKERTPTLRVSEVLDPQHDSLRSRLEAGVTSVAVHPGSRNVIGGLVAHAKTHGMTRDALVQHEDIGLRITLGSDPARGNRPTGNGRITMWSRRPISRMSVVFLIREAFTEALEYRAASLRAPRPDLDMYLAAIDGKIPVFWHARSEEDILTALRLAKEFGIKRNVLLEAHEIDTVAEEVRAAGAVALLGPLYHPQYLGRARGPRGVAFSTTDGTLWPGPVALKENEARALVHLAGHAGDELHDCSAVGCISDLGIEGHADCIRCFYEGGICGGCAATLHTGEDSLRFGVEAGMLYDPDEEAREACQGCCGLDSSPVLSDSTAFTALAVDEVFKSGLPLALARGNGEVGQSLLDFARFAVRSGVSPDRALGLVTLAPAQLLGLAERVGSLEVGKDADLVVFNGAPLAATSAILMVMVDGVPVLDQRAPASGAQQ